MTKDVEKSSSRMPLQFFDLFNRKNQPTVPGELEEALLRSGAGTEDDEKSPYSTTVRSTRHWHYAAHGLLMLLCIFLLIATKSKRCKCFDLPYSPANVAIEYEKDFTIFNGSFTFPSIYRGEPSPELDAAWHRISKGVALIRLTAGDLLKAGKEVSPSKVRFSESDGGGYMAFIEVAHELHCLNVIRKYLYFDYYGKVDPFFTETQPETYRTHIEHCIENLRQSIMCTANTGMITFEWVRGFSTPYPDFNTRHKCRNFEKVIDWQNAHGIYDIPQSHVMRLEGEVDLKEAHDV